MKRGSLRRAGPVRTPGFPDATAREATPKNSSPLQLADLDALVNRAGRPITTTEDQLLERGLGQARAISASVSIEVAHHRWPR